VLESHQNGRLGELKFGIYLCSVKLHPCLEGYITEEVKMIRYVIVSFGSGVLFAALDGLINANPFAQRLYEVYKSIAKTSINVPARVVIDLVYGFVMA
jgi:hypothetical protein